MAASDVKLLGAWPSPYVNRVQYALNLKSVDHEYLQETFGSKSELLLKSNPVHKKMPVLIHGNKPVCESLIIVQYIDEVWTSGPSILPSDPYDRAVARFWAAYIDEKRFPSLKEIRTAKGESAGGGSQMDPEKQSSSCEEESAGASELEKNSQATGNEGLRPRLGPTNCAAVRLKSWRPALQSISEGGKLATACLFYQTYVRK